jgi:hypothetical protein
MSCCQKVFEISFIYFQLFSIRTLCLKYKMHEFYFGYKHKIHEQKNIKVFFSHYFYSHCILYFQHFRSFITHYLIRLKPLAWPGSNVHLTYAKLNCLKKKVLKGDKICLLKVEKCLYIYYRKLLKSFQKQIYPHSKKLRRAEGGSQNVGVFRVKNHDFTPKNHIFPNFRICPWPLVCFISLYRWCHFPNIGDYFGLIYPIELEIKDTTLRCS